MCPPTLPARVVRESLSTWLRVAVLLIVSVTFALTARAECRVVGSVGTYGHAYGVVPSGEYALVADGNAGLTVLYVGDPTHPMITGSFSTPGGGYALHLAVSGHYAYLAGSQLVIVDWADPAHPVEAGRISVGWPYGVAVQGGLAYVADHDFGLKIVDVSDPAHPTLIGQVATPGPGSVHRVAVDGSFAYLVGCVNKLFVVDVSEPTQPELVASSPYVPGAYEGIVARDGLVYTSGNQYPMRVFDVSAPSQALLIGSADFPSGRGLAVVWPYAYVSTGNEVNDTGSVVVVNVSRPGSPSVVRTVPDTGYAWGLGTDGAFVYGAVGAGGFRALSLEAEPAGVDATVPRLEADCLTVVPNPAHGSALVQLDLVRGGPGRLEIFDAAGRLLQAETLGRLRAGRSLIPFRGCDASGRALTPGVYYLRLLRSGEAIPGRVVIRP
jgi:hypothetical protein